MSTIEQPKEELSFGELSKKYGDDYKAERVRQFASVARVAIENPLLAGLEDDELVIAIDKLLAYKEEEKR